MRVKKYDPVADWDLWNHFIAENKNSTFLFHRNFMDYHSDRFIDHSLMVFEEENLVAVLPANIINSKEVVSHQGLTYGGFILKHDCKLISTTSIINATLKYLYDVKVESLTLKHFPWFYNTDPTDEVEYVLFLLNAELYRRDVSFAINQEQRILYSGNIRREGRKAEEKGAKIIDDGSLEEFWDRVLVPNLLERFGVKPVHSLKEIKKLKEAFPENIRQHNIYLDGEIVGGATIFIFKEVAHCQYISSNDIGRKSGCLNYLFKHLVDVTYKEKKYFDFGIVNENNGRDINKGMLFWKEGFGGRARKHDFYKINTASYKSLESLLNKYK